MFFCSLSTADQTTKRRKTLLYIIFLEQNVFQFEKYFSYSKIFNAFCRYFIFCSNLIDNFHLFLLFFYPFNIDGLSPSLFPLISFNLSATACQKTNLFLTYIQHSNVLQDSLLFSRLPVNSFKVLAPTEIVKPLSYLQNCVVKVKVFFRHNEIFMCAHKQ